MELSFEPAAWFYEEYSLRSLNQILQKRKGKAEIISY